MPYLNTGRSGTAKLWTVGTELPNGIEIGTGSGTKSVATSGLVTPVIFRAFSSTDTSTPRFVTFTSDYTSVELSGLSIKELGVKTSGGTLWSADGFPAITFNGSIEMQVVVTWELF